MEKKKGFFLCLSRELSKRLLETNGNTLSEGHRLLKECQCLRTYLVGNPGTYFQIFNYSIQPLPEA